MAILTCVNHPELHWSCKDMAVTNGKYNGIRNIFFFGTWDGKQYNDWSCRECECPASDLRVKYMGHTKDD